MEWYEKKDNSRLELIEYQDWIKNQDTPMAPEDSILFLAGLLSNIGFHGEHVPVHEEGVFFFPFLDPYWRRPGRVWIDEKTVSNTNLITLKLKIADCLKYANHIDGVFELRKLIDYDKKPNLVNWLRLGGEFYELPR